MAHARKMFAAVLLPTVLFPCATLADPPTNQPANDADGSVVVMRGSQAQVQGTPQKAAKQRSRTNPTARTDHGVIVMRPASGSFMRETTRLASEAEAREVRAAREAAHEKDLQLIKTLRAVEDAAQAAEEEARTRSQRYYPIYVPRPHPPKARPPTDGAIDP